MPQLPGRSRRRTTAPAAPWRRSTTASRRATAEPCKRAGTRLGRWLGPDGITGVAPRSSGRRAVVRFDKRATAFSSELLQGSPGEPARENVAVLPAADGREGDAQRVGKALLSETSAVTPCADELSSIGGRTTGDAGGGGGGGELHSEVHLERALSNAHARQELRRILTAGPRKVSKVARSCKEYTATSSFQASMHAVMGPILRWGEAVAKRETVRLPTPNDLLERLKGVRYPGFTRDIVSFGLVRDIEVSSDGVTVKLAPT